MTSAGMSATRAAVIADFEDSGPRRMLALLESLKHVLFADERNDAAWQIVSDLYRAPHYLEWILTDREERGHVTEEFMRSQFASARYTIESLTMLVLELTNEYR